MINNICTISFSNRNHRLHVHWEIAHFIAVIFTDCHLHGIDLFTLTSRAYPLGIIRAEPSRAVPCHAEPGWSVNQPQNNHHSIYPF